MDPSEVEFLGEKQLVTIIPSFTFDQIHLISGSIGPFKAGLPTKVPIWLAVNLKQQQKCRIVSQEWMDVEALNAVKEHEKAEKLLSSNIIPIQYHNIGLKYRLTSKNKNKKTKFLSNEQ